MQYLGRSETVARLSVYLLFLLVPFFFFPYPWASVAQSKVLLAAVIVAVGFLAWVAAGLNAGQFKFPKSPLLIAAALIPIVYIVSALATGASWGSFAGDGRGQDTVVGFVLLYVAFFISAQILGGPKSIPALRLFIVGSLALLVAQYVHLAIPAFTFGGALSYPATSIIGSWHDLGIFLVLTVFMSFALLGTSILQGFWKLVAILIGVASLALLFVINFSDVWLGLIGISLFGAFFFRRSGESGAFNIRAIGLWGLCALGALGMYYFGNSVQTALPASLQITQVEVRPSWEGTFAIGQQVFAEPSQIFFGSGPNTFSREWGVNKPLSVNETEFWNTDFYYGVGFIPTSFVTTGVFGVVAWGAVCVALLWSLYRFFRNKAAGRVRGVLMGSTLFLTAFHILYVPGPAISLITFLLFGALVAEEIAGGALKEWSMSLSWETWRGRIQTGVLIIFGLAVALGSVQAARALVSDAFVNRAVVVYNESGDPKSASASLASALKVLPNNDRAHRAGIELGILELSQMVARADSSEETRAALQATLTTTIEHGLKAVSIGSQNYQNWLALARLYGELAGVGIEGAEGNARDAYARAQETNPTSPLPHLGLAQLELIKGDDAAARKSLETALSLKQNLAAAHFLLSQILARANNLPQAAEHAKAAVQVAPQDALGWYNLGTIFYAGGNFADAATSFEQAVAIQNNYANALFLLGLSYHQLDRREDALRALEVVASLNPGDKSLPDIIKKVKAGQSLGPSR